CDALSFVVMERLRIREATHVLRAGRARPPRRLPQPRRAAAAPPSAAAAPPQRSDRISAARAGRQQLLRADERCAARAVRGVRESGRPIARGGEEAPPDARGAG